MSVQLNVIVHFSTFVTPVLARWSDGIATPLYASGPPFLSYQRTPQRAAVPNCPWVARTSSWPGSYTEVTMRRNTDAVAFQSCAVTSFVFQPVVSYAVVSSMFGVICADQSSTPLSWSQPAASVRSVVTSTRNLRERVVLIRVPPWGVPKHPERDASGA
jgi:hypothetical protein